MIARALICIAFLGLALSAYVDKQNELTRLKMRIPEAALQIKAVREEIARLRYEIDRFESPENLLALAEEKRFSHLKHPYSSDILTLGQGLALALETKPDPGARDSWINIGVAFGAVAE